MVDKSGNLTRPSTADSQASFSKKLLNVCMPNARGGFPVETSQPLLAGVDNDEFWDEPTLSLSLRQEEMRPAPVTLQHGSQIVFTPRSKPAGGGTSANAPADIELQSVPAISGPGGNSLVLPDQIIIKSKGSTPPTTRPSTVPNTPRRAVSPVPPPSTAPSPAAEPSQPPSEPEIAATLRKFGPSARLLNAPVSLSWPVRGVDDLDCNVLSTLLLAGGALLTATTIGGLKLLPSASRLDGLASINLAHNRIGDAGARHLASILAAGVPSLQRLSLHENLIGCDGCAALAAALVPGGCDGLTSLKLGFNRIADVGAAALARAMEGGCKRLNELQLAANKSPAAA